MINNSISAVFNSKHYLMCHIEMLFESGKGTKAATTLGALVVVVLFVEMFLDMALKFFSTTMSKPALLAFVNLR